MLARTSMIACVALGTLLAARAHAQSDPDSETKPLASAAAAAGGEGGDQLTLQKGRGVLNAYVATSLSSGSAFKAVSISPDLWYGVTDDITAGVVHSAVGTTGFMGGVLQSLCLGGTSGGCSDIYSNVGVEGRYRLKAGSIALAADGGLEFGHLLSPTVLSIKVGAVGRWHQGPLAVEAAPSLFVGAVNRNSNDILSLPATVLYTLNPTITLAGQTGFLLPLENTGNAYAIPLSVGVFYHVNDQLNVTAAFSLPRLIGGSGGIDFRSLTIGGSYAL
jgi:hypothetical protein